MSPSTAQPVTIDVDDAHRVSGLLLMPPQAQACFVLAHGAGAGMTHPFMEAVATELGMRGVATLRYQFPYMEQGSKRPDPPSLAHAAVRGAVAAAARLAPELPLIAGGKSFGGRMTSQAQAASPLPGVQGLAFLGFPLHPAGRPADERGSHLSAIQRADAVPARSTRQARRPTVARNLIERLGARATLRVLQDADHSFHMPARTGRTDTEGRSELLDALVSWIASAISQRADAR